MPCGFSWPDTKLAGLANDATLGTYIQDIYIMHATHAKTVFETFNKATIHTVTNRSSMNERSSTTVIMISLFGHGSS